MLLNMKVLSVLLLLLVVCEFAQCGVLQSHSLERRQRTPFNLRKRGVSSLIVGGNSATISEFPHHLGLLEEGRYICGGSFISRFFAISAAHCLEFETPAIYINLWGGSSSRTSKGHIYGVQSYMIHPKYDRFMLDYDVAVLKAEKSFDCPLIIPASLPKPCLTECCDTCPLTTVRVVGWGYTETGEVADDLLQIKQNIMETTPECEASWGEITSRQFCVSVEKGTDSCNGDSGGGIMLDKDLIIGVVSFGSDVCGSGMPAVYTRLENVEIREWIHQNTGL